VSVHVYTASWQPATRHRVPGMRGWSKFPPHSLVWCSCCKQRRISKHVEVQVYYDMTRARCITGKGCRRTP
jgi:hypothetical protein